MTLLNFFKEKGFDCYTGVPCSEIKEFLAELNTCIPPEHILACREDEAIGIAVGAWLGGYQPLVYMQNSGLGNSVNAINSLLLPYEIPINLLVTMHHGAEHQEFTYQTTKPLLDIIKYRERTYFALNDKLEDAVVKIDSVPIEYQYRKNHAKETKPTAFSPLIQTKPLTRRECITQIIYKFNDKNTVFVSTNGLISREHYSAKHQLGFYMAGSMGLAPAIGLGLALTRPDLRVVVINGDGGYLMNLGASATIAAYSPPNLKQFVLKNGIHETTGGQPLIKVPELDNVNILSVTPGSMIPQRINVPLKKIAHDLRAALCQE